MSFLKETEVLEIKRLLRDTNLTQQQIGDKFNIGKSLVSDIKRGYSWAWLKLED